MTPLFDIAKTLRADFNRPCRMAPLVFMSDPRAPDVLEAAKKLSPGSALIYRHFGAKDAQDIAMRLREVTGARGLQFLIGKDMKLADRVGADGVHFPQSEDRCAHVFKTRNPDKIVTLAAHDPASLSRAIGLDAAIVSPVFPSESSSAGAPLGVEQFSKWAARVDVAVFALGGINARTAPKLIGSGAAGIAGVSGVLGVG